MPKKTFHPKPMEIITCPMCGFRAYHHRDTSVTYGGDESYTVRRYICESSTPHTTWTIYGSVRDLGYGSGPASPDGGSEIKKRATLKGQGGT